MSYSHYHRYKSPDKLDAYEEEVLTALDREGYTQDPDAPHDWTVFTPIDDLFIAYRQYIFGLSWREPDMAILTRQQFGAALNRVYGFDADDRKRRWVRGKRVIGVHHLRGPATVRVLDGSGRRPNTHDSYVE